jgi:hypothetical protein
VDHHAKNLGKTKANWCRPVIFQSIEKGTKVSVKCNTDYKGFRSSSDWTESYIIVTKKPPPYVAGSDFEMGDTVFRISAMDPSSFENAKAAAREIAVAVYKYQKSKRQQP